MANIVADRIKERISGSPGTSSTLTLSAAPTGFRRFSSVMSIGDTCYAVIENGAAWEIGIYTYSAVNTLTRTTILKSSNGDGLINVGSNAFVFISYIADKSIYKDGSGRAVVGSAGLIFSDNSVQTTAATTPDLSAYAPLASPVFTGTPQAPTASGGTNSTQIATTAFVASAVGAIDLSPYLTISSAASTYLTQSSATTLLAAKADLVGGLVPSSQLPSYVDDVVEAANLAAFPGTGETGKIYVALDTGYTYRWSGSTYVRINEVDLSSYLTISTAASTYLRLAGGTLTGDLKFTDATYDIGKSGATRPRDGFFSRNLVIGGTLTVVSTSSIQGRMSFTSTASQPLYFGSKTYTASDPAIQFDWGGGGGVGIYGGTGVVGFHSGGFSTLEYGSSKLNVRGSVVISPNWYTSPDTGITNGSVANTLKISNGSTGIGHCEMANLTLFNSTTSTFIKCYNTYTSSTSGEWGEFNWQTTSNVLRIGTNKGSAGGSARDVAIVHGGTVVANFLADRFYLGPIADSTAVGGNARGAGSVDLQLTRSSATQVASGLDSFLGGRLSLNACAYGFVFGRSNTNTSAQDAYILGNFCSTTSLSAVAIGRSLTVTGQAAACIGGEENEATAQYGFVGGGYRAKADRYGMTANAAGYFSAVGDAQSCDFIIRRKTTGATPVNLGLDGSTTRLTIPSGKTMTGFLIVKGIKSDGSAKARFVRLVDITNVGGTTALDTPIEAIGTDYNPSACVLAVTAENATDDLQINITGPAGETWRWVATFNGLEIAYGT